MGRPVQIIGQAPFTIRVDHQRQFLDHLDLIDRIVRTTGRRRHLSTTEQEDFAGFVRLRLIEDNYATLRKFQHRSALGTYLVSVVERLSLDFWVERWGRWRPSAVAERVGPVAVLLERLVTRDGHTLDEAIAIAQTNHRCAESSGQLRQLWGQLPPRFKLTEAGEHSAAGIASHETAETNVNDAEYQRNVERLERTLQSALARIPDQDRVVLALRFDQNMSIAEIAPLVASSAPTLHRRLDGTLRQLRRALTESGFDPREVGGLIGHPTIALSPLLRAEVESFLGRVRLTRRDG
jgi:RNA polymerase sigma factor (sigma-70 family)